MPVVVRRWGDAPCLPCNATSGHDAWVEPCLVGPADRTLVETWCAEAHRHGVAVVLKAVQSLDQRGAWKQEPTVLKKSLCHKCLSLGAWER